MKHPQLLVYETDGRLAWLLQPIATDRRWVLREPRRPEACLKLLRDAGPAVFVLRLGKRLEAGFELLHQAGDLAPDTPVIVVGDEQNNELSAMAWDLGAAYVLFPPQSLEMLKDIVVQFMESSTVSVGEVKHD